MRELTTDVAKNLNENKTDKENEHADRYDANEINVNALS